MRTLGFRQLSMLILTGAMVVVGVLGLIGIVTPTPILAAVLVLTAIVLAFVAGRTSTKF